MTSLEKEDVPFIPSPLNINIFPQAGTSKMWHYKTSSPATFAGHFWRSNILPIAQNQPAHDISAFVVCNRHSNARKEIYTISLRRLHGNAIVASASVNVKCIVFCSAFLVVQHRLPPRCKSRTRETQPVYQGTPKSLRSQKSKESSDTKSKSKLSKYLDDSDTEKKSPPRKTQQLLEKRKHKDERSGTTSSFP